MSPTNRSQSKTASITARLKYETEQAFIEKYAPNISNTGLFVKTSNPRPVGTRVKFEFQIANGTPVLRGLGEVEWDRREASQDKPPGMEIRFLKIDAKTRTMVERIVEYNNRNQASNALPSILPDKSHPEFNALMSSLESEAESREDEASSKEKPFETGPLEKLPWESEPENAAAPGKRSFPASGKVDKIELSQQTKARRAAARLRRQEGKGAGTKEVNLQSVESLLKEINVAPAPLGKRRFASRDAKKLKKLQCEELSEPTTETHPKEMDPIPDASAMSEEEPAENRREEVEPDEVPKLSLKTVSETSVEPSLDDILNETDETEDFAVDEHDDDSNEPNDSFEEIPGRESLPQEPLLDTSEVDNALNRLFVNLEVAEKSESEIPREESPKRLPNDAVPKELVREPHSKQSKIDTIYESSSPAPANSEVPVPESQPEKPEETHKKKSFFRKLFS